jgi:hypothetical protein
MIFTWRNGKPFADFSSVSTGNACGSSKKSPWLRPSLSNVARTPYFGRVWSKLTTYGKSNGVRGYQHRVHGLRRWEKQTRAYCALLVELQDLNFWIPQANKFQADKKTRIENGVTPNTLLDLIQTYWRSHTTDPKDQVYALVGLASDRETLDINIDYNISLSWAYRDLVEAVSNQSQKIDIIGFAGIAYKDEKF